MTGLKVIIVDDEVSVRNSISKILKMDFPEINITSSVGTIGEGYSEIVNNTPDLLFLDVELPDGTGFDLLHRFDSINFRVIFITGHQEYALKAIKMSALDFILKPFDSGEIRNAVEKAQKVINRDEEQIKFRTLSENMEGKKVLKRIILPTSENLHLIQIRDIIRAEADSNYTRFMISDGQKIMVSRTIKEFDTLLSGSGMVRVHQSHLVNISFVDKFVKRDGGYLQLKDGSNVPVSQSLKKKVIEAISNSLYE